MYSLIFEKKAQKQLEKIRDITLQKKIRLIFAQLTEDPYSSFHKFERLRGDKSGYCSCRLNKKDRILYRVEDKKLVVIVVSVLGHYEDK